MKNFITAIIIVLSLSANAQLQLTPTGFNTITVERPAKTDEKFIELARSWAASYNRTIDYPFEFYNVTANSFDLDAQRPNAFYYRNRGEAYYHRIKYKMHIQLDDKSYTISFSVKEIYTSNVLTEMTVGSLFAPDNRLKEEYLDAKPSLEKTANGIVKSFVDYMATY